jgi:hypothetical protein
MRAVILPKRSLRRKKVCSSLTPFWVNVAEMKCPIRNSMMLLLKVPAQLQKMSKALTSGELKLRIGHLELL